MKYNLNDLNLFAACWGDSISQGADSNFDRGRGASRYSSASPWVSGFEGVSRCYVDTSSTSPHSVFTLQNILLFGTQLFASFSGFLIKYFSSYIFIFINMMCVSEEYKKAQSKSTPCLLSILLSRLPQCSFVMATLKFSQSYRQWLISLSTDN